MAHARRATRPSPRQRFKVAIDENAPVVRHHRNPSAGGSSKLGGPIIAGKTAPLVTIQPKSTSVARPALGEVKTNGRKEKDVSVPAKEKEHGGAVENPLKRNRSSSLNLASNPPVRVQQSATRALATIRGALRPQRPVPARQVHRPPLRPRITEEVVPVPEEDENDEGMDIEAAEDDDQKVGDREVEEMVDVEAVLEAPPPPSSEVSEEPEPETRARDPADWLDISPERAQRYIDQVQAVRSKFVDEVDMLDPTMVSEYSEEIFAYMAQLEEECMPNPSYIDGQTEIDWRMRQTLVDWLLQVHLRYHMLPETLWITVNIVDRFLTKRIVSLNKLQLVGVTAMFIAAKYEEILAPSVEEFVFMTEQGYSKDEILKGERIILQTIDFRVSSYCSPYSWVRKISKADDYDIQTRTLSKFLMEVTLLDYRFLRVKPSMIAAVGMYTARKMLDGDWNDAFIYYSDFTAEQLETAHSLLIDKILETGFEKQYVYKKYAHKKFLKAAIFARDWALRTVNGGEDMSESVNVE